MTITEVAKKTGMTRNSVSKYLEVMHISGQVDVRTVGNAKLHSIAQRVPMSAFLCFTQNMILVLDSYLNIVQINDRYLAFSGFFKEDIISQNIREIDLPVVSTQEAMKVIEGTEGEQVITDVCYQRDGQKYYYSMQVIPTVFDDGERGYTIVLEDITEKKKYIRNIEFLAKTAAEFVELPEETNIYERIAEFLVEFIPNSRVFVQSYDELRNQFIIRSVMDRDFREVLTRIIGHDPVGMVFPLDSVFSSPFLERPEEIQKGIRMLDLAPRPGDGLFSFYDFVFHQIPEDACEEIVTTLNIGKAYMAFLAWKGQLLGDIGILLPAGEKPEDTGVLDSFIRQASIAISNRMTEDRLRRSEKGFQDVLDQFQVPAIIIDHEGRVNFINKMFGKAYGYSCAEFNIIQEWLEEAGLTGFSGYGGNLHHKDKGIAEGRKITIRCKNGEEKTVSIGIEGIGEGHRFLVIEEITGR